METYGLDQALLGAQGMGSSLIEGFIIIGALAFVIWNIKLALDVID